MIIVRVVKPVRPVRQIVINATVLPVVTVQSAQAVIVMRADAAPLLIIAGIMTAHLMRAAHPAQRIAVIVLVLPAALIQIARAGTACIKFVVNLLLIAGMIIVTRERRVLYVLKIAASAMVNLV